MGDGLPAAGFVLRIAKRETASNCKRVFIGAAFVFAEKEQIRTHLRADLIPGDDRAIALLYGRDGEAQSAGDPRGASCRPRRKRPPTNIGPHAQAVHNLKKYSCTHQTQYSRASRASRYSIVSQALHFLATKSKQEKLSFAMLGLIPGDYERSHFSETQK